MPHRHLANVRSRRTGATWLVALVPSPHPTCLCRVTPTVSSSPPHLFLSSRRYLSAGSLAGVRIRLSHHALLKVSRYAAQPTPPRARLPAPPRVSAPHAPPLLPDLLSPSAALACCEAWFDTSASLQRRQAIVCGGWPKAWWGHVVLFPSASPPTFATVARCRCHFLSYDRAHAAFVVIAATPSPVWAVVGVQGCTMHQH